MYQGLPFTGAPILYALLASFFLMSGIVARGIDYYRKRRSA